ncbi:MAG: hypothetical protein FIA92_07430 [Chloroflexi bacterium]|nr:hypothetical protein [Chloroflexota bacterium]
MAPFGFGRTKDEPGFAEVYLELRSLVLGLEPSAADIRPTPELPDVWGVVVDWGTDNGVGTFVALADGTGSMYTSTGGGTIGGQGQPALVDAGRRLLAVAEAVHGDLQPAARLDRPKLREVRYWILTYHGARTAAHGPDGPPDGDATLAALGDAFQDYVTAFRLLAEAQSPTPPANG